MAGHAPKRAPPASGHAAAAEGESEAQRVAQLLRLAGAVLTACLALYRALAVQTPAGVRAGKETRRDPGAGVLGADAADAPVRAAVGLAAPGLRRHPAGV